MEEVHYGGEGPHWAVVSMKKNKKKNLYVVRFLIMWCDY